MKRLKPTVMKSKTKVDKIPTIHNHSFETHETNNIRSNLLGWYDINKRDLQWRDLAKHADPNIRAYSGNHLMNQNNH